MALINVISLDRTPDRWREFEANNRAIVDYERIPAVDGTRLDPAARGLLKSGVGYSPGALGCAFSHAALWRKCVASGSALTVCEDDAIFRPDFGALAPALLAQRPEFDFVLWGWNFDSVVAGSLFGQAGFAIAFEQDLMRTSVPNFREEVATPTLLRLTRALGTPCYTVSPKGARKLLEACFPIVSVTVYFPLLDRHLENNGVDIAMNAAYPVIAAYVSFPPLVLTPNDPAASTVEDGPPTTATPPARLA